MCYCLLFVIATVIIKLFIFSSTSLGASYASVIIKMNIVFIFLVLIICFYYPNNASRPAVISRRVRRYLLFPPGSNMGIEAALSLPVRKGVNVAANIEANYVLPDNVKTYFPEFQNGSLWTQDVARLNEGFGVTRKRIYGTLENMTTRLGMNGKICLLKAICEMAESSVQHNGLFGDLLHILFTPSTSASENLSKEYMEAEEFGKNYDDCSEKYSDCPNGILQLFTTFHNP